MRKPSIFTENEIRFLRELVKNRVPFMIVGLSAAALQGAPVVTQDVDLMINWSFLSCDALTAIQRRKRA